MANSPEIHFHSEDAAVPGLLSSAHKDWLYAVARSEQREVLSLNYIFCSDDYLLAINREYLHHDTFTDIITFDNSDDPAAIEGDIFISLERVEDNARQFRQALQTELLRVMAHGLLHLCGYDDRADNDRHTMRQKEEEALDLSGKYIP